MVILPVSYQEATAKAGSNRRGRGAEGNTSNNEHTSDNSECYDYSTAAIDSIIAVSVRNAVLVTAIRYVEDATLLLYIRVRLCSSAPPCYRSCGPYGRDDCDMIPNHDQFCRPTACKQFGSNSNLLDRDGGSVALLLGCQHEHSIIKRCLSESDVSLERQEVKIGSIRASLSHRHPGVMLELVGAS